MLRRQRSLAALLGVGSSSTTNLALDKEREDAVPPLPDANVYSAAHADANNPARSGGLIRKVSNLFRSGSSGKSGAGANGSPTSARYRAATSTPDVRTPSSPASSNGTGNSGGAKLVKRPSVKRSEKRKSRTLAEELHRMNGMPIPGETRKSSGSSVSGSKFRSVKSTKSGGISSTSTSTRSKARTPRPSLHGSTSASVSTSASRSTSFDDDEDEEDDIRRPSGLGRAASLREMAEIAGRGSMGRDHSGKHTVEVIAYGDPDADADTDLRTPTAQSYSHPHHYTHHAQTDSAYASEISYSASSADEDEDEGEEDDIRRPSGLGRAVQLHEDEDGLGDEWSWGRRAHTAGATQAGFPGLSHAHTYTSPSESERGGGVHTRTRSLSSPAQVQSKLEALHALLRLPPPTSTTFSPSPDASADSSADPSVPGDSPIVFTSTMRAGSSFSRSRSAQASTATSSARTRTNPKQPPIASALPWALILAHLSLPDAARAARVSRAFCAAARGRVYGVVNLRISSSSHSYSAGVETSGAEGRYSPSVEGGCSPFDDERAGRNREEAGEVGSREREERRRDGLVHALRAPHLAARVEGVVCAGWPPWVGAGEIPLPALRSLIIFPPDVSSSPSRSPAPTARTDPTSALLTFLCAHPTLERLAIVGGEDSGFGEEDATTTTSAPDEEKGPHQQKDTADTPFLPRLTHLHAPPVLAVRLLERIAAAPFFSPPPVPSQSSNTTTSTTSPNASPAKPVLSAASLALLAPDPKRPSRLSGWTRRERGQNADSGEGHGQSLVDVFPIPPAASVDRQPEKERAPQINRIPRKPPPSAFAGVDEEDVEVVVGEKVEKVELRRVGSVGRAARAVYVQARPATIVNSLPAAPAWVKTEPHPHPLRVLRIVVPRPLYEGAAGGGRVGRAVGGVLARGAGASSTEIANTTADTVAQGLAVHLLFGPRVERRTLEKVLRTLGSGLDEMVAASVPAPPPVKGNSHLPQGAKGKAPPSSRGRNGWEDAQAQAVEKPKGKLPRGVALLEVRSPVRVAELYKIVAAVLPRYPALRTLLLTRPPDGTNTSIAQSVPPSPRSPATLGFPPSPNLRVPPSPSMPPPSPNSLLPPSPSLRTPPSPSWRTPPSPSGSLHPPLSPASTLAPPPGLHTSASHFDAWAWEWDGWGDAGDVLAGVDAPALPLHVLHQKPQPDVPADVGDDESVMFNDNGKYYSYGDAGNSGGGLSREDAAHVAAWRRRCMGLECVRMVSGAWWLRDGE